VARVLELEGYQEAGGYMYKEIEHTRQVGYVDEQGEKRSMEIAGKWICTYSGIRAEKDRRDRERLIQKAMEIVERGKKSVVEHKTGHRRYIQKEFKEGDGSYQLKLDEAKIEADARYDGYYVIETSHLDIHPIDVLEIYHNLWKVEESFRVMKSTMQVRPIFHWTPRRIEGHFVMSFIAFLLGRELEIRLKKNRKTSGEISMERIKEAINTLEVSEIEVEGERLFLKGKHDMLAGKIWDVLRIEQLGRVSSLEEIRAWYSRYTVG